MMAAVAVAFWAAAYFTRIVPLAAAIPLGLIPLALGAGYGYLVRISTEYRIFSDSLEVESGIIARNIDNIQLFRVRDVGLNQSMLGRMLNVGNVAIASTDQSAPHLVLRGVDNPRDMYETLRELIAKSQAARRTMIVEEELPGSMGDS